MKLIHFFNSHKKDPLETTYMGVYHVSADMLSFDEETYHIFWIYQAYSIIDC